MMKELVKEKKSYERPALKEYGALRQMTQGGSIAAAGDGGATMAPKPK